jgi:hypothetical protein
MIDDPRRARWEEEGIDWRRCDVQDYSRERDLFASDFGVSIWKASKASGSKGAACEAGRVEPMCAQR